MNQDKLLTDTQIAEFHSNGVLILKGFYDLERDICPIQQAIYEIIGLIISKYDLPIVRPDFSPKSFDAGFLQLIAIQFLLIIFKIYIFNLLY